MSWKFNPPPGWPEQPEGWEPPPGWVPDPSWPPPPAGWQFWMPAAPPPLAAAPPPAAPPPASGASPFGPAPAPPFSSGAPSFGSGAPAPFASPAAFPAGGAATAPKPWFGRWWGILSLIALLLVGAAAGYGATRVALDASDDNDTNAAGNLDPAASESPLAVPTAETPEAEPTGLPSLPPLEVGTVCSEVAVIMLTMTVAPIEETEDPEAYVEVVVDSRRTAAGELRELEGEDADQQADLDTFADEVDAAAQMVEDDPDNADTVQASFDRVTEAYDAFNNEHCI